MLKGQVSCFGWNHEGQLGFGYVSEPPIDYVGGAEGVTPAEIPRVQIFPP